VLHDKDRAIIAEDAAIIKSKQKQISPIEPNYLRI